MKKIKFITFIFIITLLFFTMPSLNADIGPKKTLKIEIIKDSTRDLEIDLIFKREISAGYTREYDKIHSFISEELYNFLYDKSIDGYISGHLYAAAPYGIKKESNKNIDTFIASYYYPQNAKILIRDKTSNQIIITETFSQTAFDASVEINSKEYFNDSNYDEITIIDHSNIYLKEEHEIFKSTMNLLIRIILTVIIELFILFLFRYKKKQSYIFVGITNVITQTILTIGLFLILYTNGSLLFMVYLVLGEIVVISTEAILYLIFLKERPKIKALFYAIVANIATIFVGLTSLL